MERDDAMKFVASLNTRIYGVFYAQGQTVDTSEWTRRQILQFLNNGLISPSRLPAGTADYDWLGQFDLDGAGDGDAIVYEASTGRWLPGPGGGGAGGQDGQDGASAYDIAVANGFPGTEAEWLESLIGPAGDQGAPGPSAYQVAVANGFTGSEAEWLESLVGPQGDPGPPGTTSWGDLSGKPLTFPPDEHSHDGSGGGASTLGELTDVDDTGRADGYLLHFDAASGIWLPVAPSGGSPHDHDARYVRTVNGVGPDADGNVAVAGSGGGWTEEVVLSAPATEMSVAIPSGVVEAHFYLDVPATTAGVRPTGLLNNLGTGYTWTLMAGTATFTGNGSSYIPLDRAQSDQANRRFLLRGELRRNPGQNHLTLMFRGGSVGYSYPLHGMATIDAALDSMQIYDRATGTGAGQFPAGTRWRWEVTQTA